MKRLLFLSILFYSLRSTAQVISASVEDRSRHLLHTIKWTSREKQGFQDGNNIIQIEKTGNKAQLGYTVRLDGMKHALIIHKISVDDKEIAINKLTKQLINRAIVKMIIIRFFFITLLLKSILVSISKYYREIRNQTTENRWFFRN